MQGELHPSTSRLGYLVRNDKFQFLKVSLTTMPNVSLNNPVSQSQNLLTFSNFTGVQVDGPFNLSVTPSNLLGLDFVTQTSYR
jgi:hypothetical protein